MDLFPTRPTPLPRVATARPTSARTCPGVSRQPRVRPSLRGRQPRTRRARPGLRASGSPVCRAPMAATSTSGAPATSSTAKLRDKALAAAQKLEDEATSLRSSNTERSLEL